MRHFGVEVAKLSVFLGPALWRKTDRHGTVWALGVLPVGGFVRQADSEAHDALPPMQKLVIALAGPVFSLLPFFVLPGADMGLLMDYVYQWAISGEGSLVDLLTQQIALSSAPKIIVGFATLSGLVGLTNLLPIPPLDGGRIALALLELPLRGKRAYQMIERVLMVIGLFIVIWLIFIR